MKKKYLISACLLFFCTLLIFSNSVAAKVYVDIDSPTFQLIPVAISDFNEKSSGSNMPADSGITVSEQVRKDLSLTGIFNILNKKSFLEGKDSGPATST